MRNKLIAVVTTLVAAFGFSLISSPAHAATITVNVEMQTPYAGNGSAAYDGNIKWLDAPSGVDGKVVSMRGVLADYCADGAGDGFGARLDIAVYNKTDSIFVTRRTTGVCGPSSAETIDRNFNPDGPSAIQQIQITLFEYKAVSGGDQVRNTTVRVFKNPFIIDARLFGCTKAGC